MANTTNFNWSTPDDTALVKDGASAIRTLGSAIDSTLVDLKGGTTGQVLSKASGTDMDFTWVAVDPLTILDAKGDLITATAADTPSRLAVGTNGQVLTADSTAANGIKWAEAPSGELTLLSTTTISSGVSSVTVSSISSAYKTLYVEIYGVTVSGGSNASELKGYIGATSNAHATLFTGYAENDGTVSQTSKNFIALTGFDGATAKPIKDSNSSNYWYITIPFYASTTRKAITVEGSYTKPDNNAAQISSGGGIHYSGASPTSPVAVSDITFETTAGTFGAGTIKVYGSK